MTVLLETTDVAPVDSAVMLTAIRSVVQSGRAMVFFEGADKTDREIVENAFWNTYEGNTTVGGMALIRLWGLVDVLQSRRMLNLLMQRGFRFIVSAAMAAGELRLNVDWGFMPQRLYWAIDAIDADQAAKTPAPIRIKPLEMAVLPIAA